MSIYNRYIEDNHEIIEIVDYKNPYKSYVMYIYNKKYKLICDDYYQLLFRDFPSFYPNSLCPEKVP